MLKKMYFLLLLSCGSLEASFDITVKFLFEVNNGQYKLKVKSDTTINELKDRFNEAYNFPSEEQKFIFNGKLIWGEKSLGYYGINKKNNELAMIKKSERTIFFRIDGQSEESPLTDIYENNTIKELKQRMADIKGVSAEDYKLLSSNNQQLKDEEYISNPIFKHQARFILSKRIKRGGLPPHRNTNGNINNVNINVTNGNNKISIKKLSSKMKISDLKKKIASRLHVDASQFILTHSNNGQPFKDELSLSDCKIKNGANLQVKLKKAKLPVGGRSQNTSSLNSKWGWGGLFVILIVVVGTTIYYSILKKERPEGLSKKKYFYSEEEEEENEEEVYDYE